MKKILWLPSWYPNKLNPFTGDFIQRHALAVATHQPLQVLFVIKDEAATVTRDKSITVEHFQKGKLSETIAYFRPFRTGIKPVDRLISILTYMQVNKQLIREFINRESVPALVHVHVAMWAGVPALWLKRRFNIPYLLTEHWTGYEKTAKENAYQKDIFYRYYLKKVLHNTKLLLPVNVKLGKSITSHFSTGPCMVVPNVVDTKYFFFNPSPLPVFRFIHVSDMSYQKNCAAIINCFGKLLQHKKNIELVMVGPAGSSLQSMTAQTGLADKVIWKGEVSYLDVAEEMRQASCLVMFSRYENLPCVILEALCCGLPVISSDTGGIPEVIDNDNGILVNAAKENELTGAMEEMINSYEKYNRQQIASDAAEKFNYEVVGNTITSAYENFL
jgi:glycosyltransferase involved in cell wall biosynthesis